MLDQLLPPNATAQDHAIAGATTLPADLHANIGDLGRVADCPEALLPWLAWAMSLDAWDPTAPVAVKRSAIAASVGVHRRKGTLGSVRAALESFGFGPVEIAEGKAPFLLNGTVLMDGSENLGDAENWANYRVYLTRPITIDQADQVRTIVSRVAPARCVLAELNFVQAQNRLNGAILLDGTYTLGIA